MEPSVTGLMDESVSEAGSLSECQFGEPEEGWEWGRGAVCYGERAGTGRDEAGLSGETGH